MNEDKNSAAEKSDYEYSSIDLLGSAKVKGLVKARPFQFTLQLPLVAVFLVVIFSGIYGVPNPGANLATVATWTVWWVGIVLLILFLGAIWCTICPWSAISDWIERLSFWNKTGGIGLGKKWPKFLRNRHPATLFFIFVTWLEIGIFITYSPLYTAYLAFLMLFLSILITLVYEKKTFCRYFCFVGGIVGMYSNIAPVEIRSISSQICADCKTKDCIKGNEKGYGCPTFLYPGGMRENTNCIACTECIKTCPHDNMTVRARPFIADINPGYKERFDEAILILSLLSLTLLHGFTMLPIWTNFAKGIFYSNYGYYMMVFSSVLVGFVLFSVAMHFVISLLIKFLSGARDITLSKIFTKYSYSFLPVAFFYHLSHNFHHLDMEGMAIIPVLSDPFGYGWDLLGLKGFVPFSLIGPTYIAEIQAAIILIGILAGIYIGYRTTESLFGEQGKLIPIMIPLVMGIMFYCGLELIMAIQPMAMRTVSTL